MKSVVIVAHDAETSRLWWEMLCAHQVWSPVVVVDGFTLLRSLSVITPDLVILENVANNPDGLRTYQSLRAHPRGTDVPVLLVTEGLGKSEAALLTGTHAVLEKPVDQGALTQCVAAMLEGSESEAAVCMS